MSFQRCPVVFFGSANSRRSTARAATLAAAITFACFTATPRAQAQTTTITVTSLQDSGSGTLRAAITQSASTPVGQSTIINFASGLGGVIPLGSTLSVCNGQTLTIQGPAASQIAVSGQNTVPVFNLCGGTNVTISDLTIENGFGGLVASVYTGGGGIQNLGTLTVTKSTFFGNSAGNALTVSGSVLSPTGGGILNLGGLTVTNCTFSGNSATLGGAIANWNALTGVNATNSTFSGNQALVAGVAAVIFALLAGLVASTVEARRARLAERSALAAKQTATMERDRAVAAEAQAEQATGKAAASEALARRDRDRADTEAATAKAVNEFLQKDLLAQGQ